VADELDNQGYAAALGGMITGALAEAVVEIVKEFRRDAGSDVNDRLDALEAKAIASIKNAALDGVPEDTQLRLIEQAQTVVAAIFADARK
jgi:hypothetical protein